MKKIIMKTLATVSLSALVLIPPLTSFPTLPPCPPPEEEELPPVEPGIEPQGDFGPDDEMN